jgi:uncharacterized membrane protein HdeD (DUF308 family)
MTMDPRPDSPLASEIKTATGWVIALSLGIMALGLGAIVVPMVAVTAFTAVIGWLALASGVLQVGQAFQAKPVRGLVWSLGVGLLYIAGGLYILANPVKTAAVLALAFGLLFIAEGVFTILMAFTHRVGNSVSWLVAINGIITLILGILVINRWPIGSLWLIGLYLGISLLFSGLSLLAAALAVRKAAANR